MNTIPGCPINRLPDRAVALSKTIGRAVRASRKDGRLRFVVYAHGLRITVRRPKSEDCVWTNGEQAGWWQAGKPSGTVDPALTDAFHLDRPMRRVHVTKEKVDA